MKFKKQKSTGNGKKRVDFMNKHKAKKINRSQDQSGAESENLQDQSGENGSLQSPIGHTWVSRCWPKENAQQGKRKATSVGQKYRIRKFSSRVVKRWQPITKLTTDFVMEILQFNMGNELDDTNPQVEQNMDLLKNMLQQKFSLLKGPKTKIKNYRNLDAVAKKVEETLIENNNRLKTIGAEIDKQQLLVEKLINEKARLETNMNEQVVSESLQAIEKDMGLGFSTGRSKTSRKSIPLDLIKKVEVLLTESNAHPSVGYLVSRLAKLDNTS